MNRSRSLISLLTLVLPVFVAAGLVWACYRFSKRDISGEGFSIQWISIHSLAKSGLDPYSDEVTAQIRSSVASENSFVTDIYPKYTSPLFSGVLVFPFTLFGDETIAHAMWMATQLILILVMILLSLNMAGWKPSWTTFFLFTLFTLFSYHVAQPWLDGGLSIWSSFFLVLTLVALRTNRLEMGGVFLAAAVVQPQLVFLPMIFIFIWCISTKKAILILWFFIAVIMLTVIGLFLVPGWIIQYLHVLYKFSENFPPGTPSLFFSEISPGLGKQVGWLITGITSVILIVEWLLALRKEFRWFLWTVCLTMVLSQWVGIPTIPANFVMLVLPAIIIAGLLVERWPRIGSWGAVLLSFVIFAWGWAIFYLDMTGPQPAFQLNLIFPGPLVLLVGLYWVRWRATKPRRMLIEELKLSEIY